ncbi:methionyl-tRNA formyltransferase [Thermaurantimonas aggregans]|uniref:Methionyl-tRNA formyltransferase n=1 Tax=Thermaurantimonas aggregans TaxID=2173829 RepID=A0A401XJU5_9FLAO|nr:methionyl-tRNA formyltransferase [Thermaurantimonas aggregans]GCD77286.1 methionyl-tRNA formyltransferase [Thermaurantimonas aggregans]
MKPYPRIVYMGTPYFAVPGLKKLIENNYNVVTVVTTPDKPAGRGLKMQSSPVKQAAIELGIPVLEPFSLKSDDFFEALKSYNPDIQIVVAFKKLPDRVWQLPPLGTFNLHASLLPQYRGAAPINWAIINGEQETGLTTFFINDKIDEGNLLLQTKIPITPDMTAGELHDAMLEPGAELILKTLEGILNNSIVPKKQEIHENLKTAPKIFKENCLIDWTKGVLEVHNFIRGLSPNPGAYTVLEIQNKPIILKILRTKILGNSIKIPPKTLHVENKKQLIVGCADGALSIEKLMPEGKKEMTASEFLNGVLNKTNLIKINS